ncbi:unnamed protein product [Salmonella enterica subsp. enterica serovar Typhimurium str. DT2]|nr:unnamed protein product [Salmonella enterica subsp. enterica serovar Typhimurium str. DT2]
MPDGAALIRPTVCCRPDKAFMPPSGTGSRHYLVIRLCASFSAASTV